MACTVLYKLSRPHVSMNSGCTFGQVQQHSLQLPFFTSVKTLIKHDSCIFEQDSSSWIRCIHVGTRFMFLNTIFVESRKFMSKSCTPEAVRGNSAFSKTFFWIKANTFRKETSEKSTFCSRQLDIFIFTSCLWLFLQPQRLFSKINRRRQSYQLSAVLQWMWISRILIIGMRILWHFPPRNFHVFPCIYKNQEETTIWLTKCNTYWQKRMEFSK